jgi:hypothetical protein
MNELNVKVGDKVIVRNSAAERIATVTRVTQTGRIRTDKTGCTQFDKYGREMGGDIWFKSSIYVPTENDYKRMKDIQTKTLAVRLMRDCNVDNITVQQAEQIISVLGR